MRHPTIAIDPGGLDVATPRGGQFRYVVDLVHGLDRLAPDASFVFLGGRPVPVAELAAVFGAAGSRWRYVPFVRPTGRAAMYREQVQLAMTLLRTGAHLYHGLHTIVPVLAPCPVVTTVLDLMYDLFPEYAPAARSRSGETAARPYSTSRAPARPRRPAKARSNPARFLRGSRL